MAYDYEYLKKEVFRITKIDLNSYKQTQMERRLNDLMMKNHIKRGDYKTFVAALENKQDKTMLEKFLSHMTINVSEFFRDPMQWNYLDKEVFPSLINRFGKNLKIWSAACSTGDEPYSLVMALSRHLPLANIRIYATDLDNEILSRAKMGGPYPEKSVANVPKDLKAKYLKKEGDFYRVSDEIKKCVTFKQQNLLKDPYVTSYHMIVCRNVLIYFTEEAKTQVFKKFNNSLATNGILFIGSSENIMTYKDLGYERKTSFFYEKV